MADSLNSLLENFDTNGTPVSGSIEDVEKHFGCVLPGDYKKFIEVHDGGEGFIGKQYIILWRTGELVDFNRDYEVSRYAPGLLLFGSNGGGEAMAFDTREAERMRTRVVPFIGMSLQDAKLVADTFEGLLFRLAKSDETL